VGTPRAPGPWQHACRCTLRPAKDRSCLAYGSGVAVFGRRDAASAENCGDRFRSAALVCGQCAGSALAADAGWLCDLDFGNHAAADAGEDGDSLLGTLDAGVADD